MDDENLVLLIEDNPALNRINRRALELEGYAVASAMTLAEARRCLDDRTPDVIVLDIMMPDGSGVDFCREIRDRTAAPILFLTSVRGRDRAIEGLRAGGDDYITKPHNLEIMLAKIASFIRRDRISESIKGERTMTPEGLTLDVPALRAAYDGRDMMLTPKEFAILCLLVRSEGEVLTKESIIEKVWSQPGEGDVNTLWMHISRLKKKLAEAGGENLRILTIRGIGYKLCRENSDARL